MTGERCNNNTESCVSSSECSPSSSSLSVEKMCDRARLDFFGALGGRAKILSRVKMEAAGGDDGASKS